MAADPRPVLHRALAQLGALAETAGPADLGRPTPCEGWDVRTLLGHLVAVQWKVAAAAEGGAAGDLPFVADLSDGEHPAALAEGRAAIAGAWADAAVLDADLTLPWATMPGREVAWAYALEGAVHAWDLAVPLGLTATLDGPLAEATLQSAHRLVPAEPRGGPVPFGPPVALGDDAGPYARLVGWLGRTP